MLWERLTILVFLGTLQTTQSLKCYVCNSHLDTDCGTSKPSESYLVECTDATAQPGQTGGNGTVRDDANAATMTRSLATTGTASGRNYTFCRKNVISILEQNNGNHVRPAETRVLRSCGWVEPLGDLCKWASEGHYLMCSCVKDSCNSVPVSTQALHFFSYALFVFIAKICM